MRSSTKGGKKKIRQLGDHILTLRRRLHDALSLGIRFVDNKGKTWECTDAGIQLHALKAMATFVDCISYSVRKDPLIKDSISDMLLTLVGVLQSHNKAVLSLAADVTVNLVCTMGNSIRQFPMLDLIISLPRLLSTDELAVATSFATALNCILTNLSPSGGVYPVEVRDALEKTSAIVSVSSALQSYVHGFYPVEYCKELAALLTTILGKWPLARRLVWNDDKLMIKLQENCTSADTSVACGTLKLYSALALCGNGAMKLLENTELLSEIFQHMGRTNPLNIRMETLILCQQLMRSSKECVILTSLSCESIVQGIIDAMGEWRSVCPLAIEACRTAMMTRWDGPHHSCFWVRGIDKLLLDMLVGNCSSACKARAIFSSKEQLATISENIGDIHAYIWDIFGYLVAHSEEDFHPTREGPCYLDTLIFCACSLFSSRPDLEPVSRAVLMIVLSPCKYIASQAKFNLSEHMKAYGDDHLESILSSLKLNVTGGASVASDSLHTMANLISLSILSTLPQYHHIIIKSKGVKILSTFIKRCINSDIHVGRSNIASHLHNRCDGRTCCWDHPGEWEGEDILLFYSLLALSQLLRFSNIVCDHCDKDPGELIQCTSCVCPEAQDLIHSVQYILNNCSSPGSRFFAADILSFFGFYGFPNKLGRKTVRAVDDDELADLVLLLQNGQSFNVHGAILVARCPCLLPFRESFWENRKLSDDSDDEKVILQGGRRSRREVRMSNHVDSRSLQKILEYVYTGYTHVDNDLVKSLKVIAKHCRLKFLSDMLYKKQPRWGSAVPSYDLLGALEATGPSFSDIILEANTTESVVCYYGQCRLLTAHIHAHKIILCMSCDYLRALFKSGMHESFSEIIKVPVGWRALDKLVHWFYSGELPIVKPDCRWKTLNQEEQLSELWAYVELSSLAEFWCLDEVGAESLQVIVSCLKSEKEISIEIIQFAANMGQWKIVQAAIRCMVPLYPKLRDGGRLEELDEEVVSMLRTEYTRYSQGDCEWSD